MIAALGFGTPRPVDGRALREPVFRLRSTLPISAVCLLGNGVRETLGRLLGRELEVEVIAPAVPGPDQRRVLFADAIVHRVRGELGDVAIVLRRADAHALACAAFGEHERDPHAELSEIERRTLDRLLAAIVPLCTPLCGTPGAASRDVAERCENECASYVELRIAPLGCAIGFALSRDPPEEIGARVALDALLDVPIALRAILAEGEMPIPRFARLAPGDVLPLAAPLDGHGRLLAGGVVLGTGPCGTRGGRRALALVDPLKETSGV